MKLVKFYELVFSIYVFDVCKFCVINSNHQSSGPFDSKIPLYTFNYILESLMLNLQTSFAFDYSKAVIQLNNNSNLKF